MQGTYYETDRVFALIFCLVMYAIFVAVIHYSEKKQGINDRNRAQMYRKNRNER